MAFNFRYNSTNYKLATSDKGDVNFCYREGGSTCKVPASSTRGSSVLFASDDNYTYYMDNSSPTICFRKNDTTYYCAKSIETVVKYDIPAGTYTPSAFEALIKTFVSENGYRTAYGGFSVTITTYTIPSWKGTTVTCDKETDIHYYVNSSSPQGFIRSVVFGTSAYAMTNNAPHMRCNTDFVNGKTYVVYSGSQNSGIFYPSSAFPKYANYNITVTTGIKFK